MKSVLLTFSNAEQIVDFVSTTNYIEEDVDVKQGRYLVSGKSLIGLLSIVTIDKPVEVIIHNDTTNIEIFKKWWANKED